MLHQPFRLLKNYRHVQPNDEKWVIDLFVSVRVLGDAHVARSQWFRYWSRRQQGEFWIVREKTAFTHFKVKKDNSRTIYEIAVSDEYRRSGVASELVKIVGRPVTAKTDIDNVAANAFYTKNGFILMAKTKNKNNSQHSNIWQKG